MFNWLRYAAALAAATLLVLLTTALILDFFDNPNTDPVLEVVHGVDVLHLAEHPEIEAQMRQQVVRNVPEPPPPPDFEREVSGFVQLEFTVNPDGSVSNVDVVGAVPAGVYEEQAKQIIEARRYTPEFTADTATARRETEVIQFSVPAESVTVPDENQAIAD